MKGNNVFENVVNGLKQQLGRFTYNPYKKAGFSWLQTRVIKNFPAYKTRTVKFLNAQITFHSRPEFLHSIEEIFVDEIYKIQLKPDAYIIDCGANIGLSVIYLKRRFPQATVIAYEPDETNFTFLRKNIDAFGLKDVDLRKEAVWIENTKISFSSDATQMSKIAGDKETSSTIEVEAIRLKDLLIREVDFLKIDIEGSEYEVLKDIEPSLHFVKNMFVEYHGTFFQTKELNELFQLLTRQAFTYYLKTAADKHPTPFIRNKSSDFDLQLNIFCFRDL